MSVGGFNALEKSLKGLSAAQILVKTSTLGLTDAQKLELVQAFATDAANYSNVTSLTALSASEGVATGTTLGLSDAFKGLWATLMANPIILVIGAAVAALVVAGKEWDKYIHRLDDAKEQLESTSSELESVRSEIETTTAKIKELESLDTLSITDKEDLEQLREQNKELAIRQKYLEMQQQEEQQKVVDIAKENYNQKYQVGKTNRESVDNYKTYLGESENNKTVSKPTGSNLYETPAIPDSSQNISYESDALTILIAKYEDYEQKKKEAIEAGNAEDIKKYDDALKETSTSLQKQRTELQGYKEDLSATGEASAELDDVNQKLQMIDSTLLTPGQNLVNFINSEELSADKEKLIELAESGKLTTDILKEKFSKVDEYLKENGLTLEDLISILGVYKDELDSINGSSSLSISFTDIESKVQSLSEGLDQLDSIYADILDGEDFDWSSILNNDGFAEVFGNLTNVTDNYKNAYEDFIKTVSNSPNDINACQDAFNNLATAYIQNSGVLDELTEETRNATVAQLEQMGIANAAEIADKQLAIEKERVALASSEIANTLNWENSELFASKDASDVATIAMAQLALEKLGVNENKIETSADIEQIIALANTALAGAEALAQLARAKDVLAAVESAGGGEQGRFRAGIDTKTYQEALDVVEKLNNGTYEFGFSALNAADFVAKYNGGVKSLAAAEKNAASATDKATDALKEKKETLEETQSALEETKNEMDDLKSAIDWFFDKQEDKWDTLIDKINKANEVLEKQKDNYDDILSAIENNIDIEIQALQDKIDALDKANGASEKEIQLEKAKQALIEAQSRKSIMVYTKNRGFTYQVDQNAIAEAQEEYDKANAEKVKEEINDQIDQLEELKNRWNEIPDAYEKAMAEIAASNYFGTDWRNITLNPSEFTLEDFKNSYTGVQANIASNDLQIEQYEAEKEKIEELRKHWDDAVNAYKYGQYEAKLSAYFGSDYEYQLLNNSASWSAKFASEYADICKQIEDIETQIKNLSADTASSIVSESQKAADSLAGTGNAIKNVRNTASQGDTVSKYLWSQEDSDALASAQTKLDLLNKSVDNGGTLFVNARDKLQTFVDSYGGLRDGTASVSDLNKALSDLNQEESASLISIQGIFTGVRSRISDSKNWIDELVISLQSVNDSEQEVQSKVDNTVSDASTTVSDVSEKVSLLNQALSELTTSRQEIENIVNTEVTDADTLVSTSQEKITGIQTLVSELVSSIGQLETFLIGLISKMQELDAITLDNVLSVIGFGVEENSGLYGGIQNILTVLNGEEGLISQLTLLDQIPLDTISAEFNGEAESLKFSIMDVITTISGEEGLIVNINRLTETINNIESVKGSFVNLESQVYNCVVKVNELYDSIEALHDKTITITTVHKNVGGSSSGSSGGIPLHSKGGIITNKDKSPYDYLAQKEDHITEISNGEAIIPKKSVEKNPEIVDALINGDDIPKNGLNPRYVPVTSMTLGGKTFTMDEFYEMGKQLVASPQIDLPTNTFKEMLDRGDIVNNTTNNNQNTTELHFHGNLSFPNITDGNDARKLIDELSSISLKAHQYANKR